MPHVRLRSRLHVLLIVSVSLLSAAATQAAFDPAVEGTSGAKSIQLPHLQGEPEIDGDLDDAIWRQATVITNLHQMTPVEYGEPSQRTEVRVFYTDDAIFVAARMYETDPSLIRANVMRQNQGLVNDDSFNLMLDPYYDHRSGYLFEINANGVRVDGIYQNVTNVDRNWSGIWQAKSRIDDKGWTTEIRIPFQTLSFDPSNNVWGINFRRTIRRNNEEIAWVSSNRLINPSIAGNATGLTGLQQGLGLDVVPYFVARHAKTFGAAGTTDDSLSPQLDLYYKVTPQLNAALTLNTDFSATEVDDRVVNLTRFSLFFPERRDFFNRDTDIFQFGRIGNGIIFGQEGNEAIPSAAVQNGRPFFSRNIGLSSNGAPVDITAGAKLSGRVGQWNVGTIAVRQGEDLATKVDAQTVFVGRAALNVLQESQIGVIGTSGDARSNLSNSMTGADFRYRNSRLPGGRVVEGEVWYQKSNSQQFSGDDSAYGFGIAAPNSNAWRGGYSYKHIDNNFNPALGFVNQRGIDDQALDFGYRKFLLPGGAIRSIYGGFDGYRSANTNTGDVISETYQIRGNINNPSNDVAKAYYAMRREVLTRPFTIYRATDGKRTIVIPVGDYRFNQSTVSVATAGQREWAGTVSVTGGDYYSGDNLQTTTSVTWQPKPGYSFSVSYSENDISLPQGDFLVRQWSFSSVINFTPDLTWSNRLQYDNVSETLGINSRLYWVPQAGRESYLVLNWGLADLDKDGHFTSTNNDLTVKYNYTFRF